MPENMIDLPLVQRAVRENAAAFRARTRLQPAGGEGDKVFPPTYQGGKYARERRRVPGRDEQIECVLLDSVQSQANRMEEALQDAVDAKRIELPVIEVDFGQYFPGEDLGDEVRLREPVGKITSLQAPHRIADAILRDSYHGDVPFRASDVGKKLDLVGLRNATPLFELCPTALLFGMWDSTGPKGGLGAKFERALVSEVVGVNAAYGVKTSSRIDPLGIRREAGPIYRTPNGLLTLDPEFALDEKDKNGQPTGKKILYKRRKGSDVAYKLGDDKLADEGRAAKANHGNIPPSWQDNESKQDLPGGVTLEYAEQTTVISLPALRRLRFPLDGKTWEATEEQLARDAAARTVLVALGLCAASLATEAGLDLRSRCLLWAEDELHWQLLRRGEPETLTLPPDVATKLFADAVSEAKKLGLPWREEPLVLQPREDLVKLVVKSQLLALKEGVAEAGDA